MSKGDLKLGKCNVLLKQMLRQNHVATVAKPINQLNVIREAKNALGK